MPRLIIPVIILLLVASGGFYLYQNLRIKPSQQQTTQNQVDQSSLPSSVPPATSSPIVQADLCGVLTEGNGILPKLYSNVSWTKGVITDKSILEYDSENNPSENIHHGCMSTSTGLTNSLSNEIMTYYYKFVNGNDWNEVFSADSPDGSIVTYKKANRYLYLEERINPNVSSETQKYDLTIFYSE